MKKILSLILVVTLLSGLALSVSCGDEDEGYFEETPSWGKVVRYWGEWKDEFTPDNYQKYEVKALVTNNGGIGTVIFKGRIDGDTIGTTETDISNFLDTGQEETITFSFWAKGESAIQVWAINDSP
ncbi:hypothetical protein ACFLTP_02835 [Chloroflexota bacterium]